MGARSGSDAQQYRGRVIGPQDQCPVPFVLIVDAEVVFACVLEDGEALAAQVLLRGRDPQIGNGFSRSDHEIRLLVFYLTDTKHGMRHVPCY